jgi:hypothetical protein
MNKIERAIYDAKLRLNDCKDRIRLALKEKEILEDQVQTLELIEANKSILHIEVKPNSNKE